MKNWLHILMKTNLQWAKDEEQLKLKNKEEIDASHKSQLKFEYNGFIKLHNKN